MKNKKIIVMLMAASLCLFAAGCSSSGGEGSGNGAGGNAEKSVVLRAGFSTSEADPRVVATQLFKEEVEAATDGRITVEIHSDGELGGDSELISGIVNGEVDITASSAGNFATYAPNVGVSAFPFLFNNFDEAWAFVDSETETEAEEGLKDNNVKVLGHYDNGFRCVTTSEAAGPVNSVADMQGLKIRVPENPVVITTMQLLGAEPSKLDFNKLKDALANGEYDAQENPIPVIYNNNLYEVQANLAITNHSYDVMLFVIRQDVWDGLSAEDQKILADAAKKAQEKDREMIKSQTEDYIQKLEGVGMTVTYPNLDEFKAATATAVDTMVKDYGYDPDLLEKVRQ